MTAAPKLPPDASMNETVDEAVLDRWASQPFLQPFPGPWLNDWINQNKHTDAKGTAMPLYVHSAEQDHAAVESTLSDFFTALVPIIAHEMIQKIR